MSDLLPLVMSLTGVALILAPFGVAFLRRRRERAEAQKDIGRRLSDIASGRR